MISPDTRLIGKVSKLEHRIDAGQSVIFDDLSLSEIESPSSSPSAKTDDGDVNTVLENRASYLLAVLRSQFARRDVSHSNAVDIDAYPIPSVGALLTCERRPKVLSISLHALEKRGPRVEERIRKPIAKVLAAPFPPIARQIGERPNLLGLACLALKQIKETHNANYCVTTEK